MYAVTAAEFTAEGTTNIRINRYIPLWGCPRCILSDNGLQFCSKFSHAVYQLLGVRKIATSSYHSNGNSGVERVNHTMGQMLAMVVNKLQTTGMDNSPMSTLRTTISLAPPRVWLPTKSIWIGCHASPLTFFERGGVAGHQSYLAFYDLATDRQLVYDIVREHRALSFSRVNRRNAALCDALRPAPKFDVYGWGWVYN